LLQDGYGLQTTEVLTIRILDIQDTPPVMQGGLPYVVTITENMPIVRLTLYKIHLQLEPEHVQTLANVT